MYILGKDLIILCRRFVHTLMHGAVSSDDARAKELAATSGVACAKELAATSGVHDYLGHAHACWHVCMFL